MGEPEPGSSRNVRLYLDKGHVFLVRDVYDGGEKIGQEHGTLSEWCGVIWCTTSEGDEPEPLGEVQPR